MKQNGYYIYEFWEKSNIKQLNLSDKINLKRKDKYVGLSNLSISCKWKNIKKSLKNNKFKISAATWKEEFELSDGSYFVSDIEDYSEHIIKKTFTDRYWHAFYKNICK